MLLFLKTTISLRDTQTDSTQDRQEEKWLIRQIVRLRYLSPLIPINLIVARVPHRRHWIASIGGSMAPRANTSLAASSAMTACMYVTRRDLRASRCPPPPSSTPFAKPRTGRDGGTTGGTAILWGSETEVESRGILRERCANSARNRASLRSPVRNWMWRGSSY